jgi:photosystem II stability/assembly factor-like uncharacterized protein
MGWAVGGLSGLILRTTDGGGTWKPQFVDAAVTLYDVFFDTSVRGWAVGSQGGCSLFPERTLHVP